MSAWLAIVNPRSGQYRSAGFDRRWLPELQRRVERVAFTDAAGSATEIARDADVEGIVVVGGDGTIFEVLGGLKNSSPQLALIPTGRGNCLARDLGIRSIADGFRVLERGTSHCMDLMQADVEFRDGRRSSHIAASTIAFGYVVDVVDTADRIPSAGSYGYALATLATRPQPFQCRIRIGDGGQSERSCTGIIVNNTVHLANFPAFVDARLEDGSLDVMILKVGWPRQTMHNLSILSGLGVYDPGEHAQCADVRVSLARPQTLMMDGQLFPGVIALSVNCLPRALCCRRDAST